ncbi:MAG TPA: carboxypeptidase-like regulatory domain-containing protein [Thermoanaerobaculia bacterium]|jgi:hypothetical protein|nr:carboxypeptidase-like regulatory domain-containing protein [Thermoanaerobaculia bacterium]
MGIRSEALNRLVIGTPCAASWDGMQGDRTRRFCAECRRDVYDFERMTPGEIRMRIEASRGSLCARITRRDGRISVLEEAEPAAAIEPVSVWADRRVFSIAATLVTAWLGVGAVHAQGSCAPIPSAAPPALAVDSARSGHAAKGSADAAATLRGLATDEDGLPLPGVTITATRHPDGRSFVAVTGATGDFRLEGLEAGAYAVEATLEGFEAATRQDLALAPREERQVDLALRTSPAETITILSGETALVPKTLPELLAGSDLAITAVAGDSTVIERQGEFAHVATDLRVERAYQGAAPGETVLYLHWERLAAGGFEIEERAKLASGTRVLAFLESSDEPTGRPGVPAYRSADFYYGVRRLGTAGLETCLEEVESLARQVQR